MLPWDSVQGRTAKQAYGVGNATLSATSGTIPNSATLGILVVVLLRGLF